MMKLPANQRLQPQTLRLQTQSHSHRTSVDQLASSHHAPLCLVDQRTTGPTKMTRHQALHQRPGTRLACHSLFRGGQMPATVQAAPRTPQPIHWNILKHPKLAGQVSPRRPPANIAFSISSQLRPDVKRKIAINPTILMKTFETSSDC